MCVHQWVGISTRNDVEHPQEPSEIIISMSYKGRASSTGDSPSGMARISLLRKTLLASARYQPSQHRIPGVNKCLNACRMDDVAKSTPVQRWKPEKAFKEMQNVEGIILSRISSCQPLAATLYRLLCPGLGLDALSTGLDNSVTVCIAIS
jgi:hypothetical protein